LLDIVTVNQQINGGQWNAIGAYSFSNKATVKVISSGSSVTVADAVKFAPVSDIIIDNGDAGTTSTGTWNPSSATDYYDTESLYTFGNASYSFEAPIQMASTISLWWTASSNRSPSVKVDIYDGNALLNTRYIDQQDNGGQWNGVGTYVFSEGAKVVITASVGGVTVADAVKFELLDNDSLPE
jgi:hypothetical protein